MKRHWLLILLVLPFLISACQPPEKGLEAEDEQNPYFRRAAKLVTEDNYYAAIQEYEKALQANPVVLKAHEQMGILYSEKLGDPVSAIYHFQKYLNGRPDASDHDQVQTYIDKAKIDFALTLPNSTAYNSEESARISKENVELKQALAQAQAQLAKHGDETAAKAQGTTNPAPVAIPVASAAKPPAAAKTDSTNPPKAAPVAVPVAAGAASTTAGDPHSYVIQKGDNLWKIARKFYPEDINGGIEKIKQANPQTTGNVKNLKLGTSLIIP